MNKSSKRQPRYVKRERWVCLDCDKHFTDRKDAERAVHIGCPRCRSIEIDMVTPNFHEGIIWCPACQMNHSEEEITECNARLFV